LPAPQAGLAKDMQVPACPENVQKTELDLV